MNIEVTAGRFIFEMVWGLILGAVFFAGLWHHVRQLPKRPQAIWFLPISFVVRISIVVGGTLFVSHGRPVEVIAILTGVIVARTLVISLINQATDANNTQSGAAAR